jgi:hypothetical protein
MDKNHLSQAAIPENFPDPVTRKKLRERAVELAVTHGGSAQDVSKADWEQAKKELSADPFAGRKESILESVPESERWNPVPGSAGHQAPESPSEDEDAEGRSQTEQLVDDGVEAAERDQMRAAGRTVAKPDHP